MSKYTVQYEDGGEDFSRTFSSEKEAEEVIASESKAKLGEEAVNGEVELLDFPDYVQVDCDNNKVATWIREWV